MAQSHAGGGSIQQTLQQNVDAEPVPLKRKKKDSGAPAGKSVVVLKSSNVTIRNDSVFMPNTIEMAQLKKKEKGQFLTNVQISSEMSKQDIKELLISLFPYLGDQRFYCASAVDNRTRLDFHGERRIWDGLQIKKKIKGNSALYIYTDEGSLGKQDSMSSKQPTLKRPHDQMTPTMQGGRRIDKGDVSTSIITQRGILAQSGMTHNIVSPAFQSQSRKPTMNIADGQAEGRNTIPLKSSLLPHTDLQGMVSSSLTRQLNSLNITSAASEQERGQLGQTAAGGHDLALVPLEPTTRQGQGAATRVQVIACNSTDQSKRGYVVRAEVDQCAGKSGSESNATGAHQEYSGTSGSDLESPLSESAVEGPSDSGIEGSDSLFVNDTVENICPESGSVKGGIRFYIALNKALPDEVKKGVAVFEGVAAVAVDKTNSLVLSGTVPPSREAGDVTVTVRTDSGQYIGFTVFTYKDDVKEMVKNIVNDDTLQFKFFKEYARELEKKNLASDGRKTEALSPLHDPHLDSSFETKQKQSLELLQLMVYTAAQTNAQRFIEMVFSTSAGQVVFNYYKDRTPLPEDVARAKGYNELAQYLQDVHTRLSLDENVHSTVIDWLELVEAVQKQSLTTHDESPVGLDLSDEDDDDSSDYFADAETSSYGSSDDDTGWPEISENKEPCIHDEISNNVQSIGECDDLPMTGSSKASFNINERIIKGESTKGQTTRNDICFVVKQGSSCLDKGRETGEYSELPSSLCCFADLLALSCEDLNNEKSISKEPCIHDEISNEVQSIGECDDLSRTCSSKASFTKNERIIKGESTKGQITRDETSFVVNQSSSCLDKREEREISELSKPQRITSRPELFVMSCEDPGEDNLIISTSRNNMAKQHKEPCMHDVTFSEVLPVEIIVSWCDDLSMTSSKASFTKKEKIVEVESTKRQTTSEDRAFAMKQGSFCLEKRKEREFSELSRPEKISFLPKLLGVSCEDLNSGDIIRTESSTGDGIYVETYIKSAVVSDHSPMNKFAMKTSDSNNDRILTGEELNQQPTAKPDGIAMNSKAHINKREEDASVVEEGVISDTEESSTRDGNYVETYIKSAAESDHSPMNKFAMKASDSNNGRILTGEELNQEPTAKPDGISMNSEAHINKEEEDASAAEEGAISDTEEPSTLVKIVSQCFNALMASDSWISTDEEFNQEPTAKPDGIAMLRNAHINKKEEYASALEEGVIMDTEGSHICGSTNFPALRFKWFRAQERAFGEACTLEEVFDSEFVERRSLEWELEREFGEEHKQDHHENLDSISDKRRKTDRFKERVLKFAKRKLLEVFHLESTDRLSILWLGWGSLETTWAFKKVRTPEEVFYSKFEERRGLKWFWEPKWAFKEARTPEEEFILEFKNRCRLKWFGARERREFEAAGTLEELEELYSKFKKLRRLEWFEAREWQFEKARTLEKAFYSKFEERRRLQWKRVLKFAKRKLVEVDALEQEVRRLEEFEAREREFEEVRRLEKELRVPKFTVKGRMVQSKELRRYEDQFIKLKELCFEEVLGIKDFYWKFVELPRVRLQLWLMDLDVQNERSLERSAKTCLEILKLFIKEYQKLLEREQLFAQQRFLAQKLLSKTKQMVNVHLVKRKRKFQATYETSNDPVSKSANSDERERSEIELVILFEMPDNLGADHQYLTST